MTQDPSVVVVSTFLPRPVAGYRKIGRIVFKGITLDLLLTDGSWDEDRSFQTTNYALTPPTGPKQETLHSVGTKEISWNLTGILSQETFALTNFLKPENRGVKVDEILIQQGEFLEKLTNCYWEDFNLTAAQNSNITFSLSGKTVSDVTSANPVVRNTLQHPLPSWATGNQFLTAWSLRHSVDMTPSWSNDQKRLPQYYRPGNSKWGISLTSAVSLQQHTSLALGVGTFTLVDAATIGRSREVGGEDDHYSYSAEIENIRHSDDNAYALNGVVLTPGTPPTAWYL
jgi:hypothetical protein